MADRRIEYSSINPLELEGDIEPTEGVKRFLELKYLDALLNNPGEQFSEEIKNTLKNNFTPEEKMELENLEKEFVNLGITYGRLAMIMAKKYPEIINEVSLKATQRLNDVLLKKGLF